MCIIIVYVRIYSVVPNEEFTFYTDQKQANKI
jgi:hypothetical protein